MLKINNLNQEQIKNQNRVNILNILRTHREVTKLDIVKRLELSITTVTTNINQLIDEGIIEESGMAESTGGRKPIILRFKENSRFSLGVLISNDRSDVVLFNLYCEIIDETSFFYEENTPFEDILDKVEEVAFNMLRTNHVEKSKVLGLGIVLPGLVDEKNLVLISAPNINVANYSFAPFSERIGLPINIENDANAAAYAELLIGNAINKNNLVYVNLADGVGTGIIIQHTLLKSVNKRAGEFGHMRITDEGLKCNCGSTGCWELYTSKKALFRFYKDLTGETIKSLEEFFDRYEGGNIFLRKALFKYVEYLMIGINNIILALDPEYVVIGGEIAKYASYIETIMHEFEKSKCSLISDGKNRIIFSALKNRGSLHGAGLLPFDQLFHFTESII